MASAGHLVRRFVVSLVPGPPRRRDATWAESHLLPSEQQLWRRLRNPDKRHAVTVARDVERRLGHEATRPVLAAALLHDIGKLESGLRTYGRVAATVSGMVAGREQAREWKKGRGYIRKVGLYLLHDELGADILAIAGSDPLTVTWAREHHRAPDEWTIDRHVADALKAADDD